MSQNDRFEALLDELERWNRKINLTAVRERNAMRQLHIEDSLTARPLLYGEQILDVGTGAGFPGLPLAIAEPERVFTLLDSNNKKIHVRASISRIGVLGLDNVESSESAGRGLCTRPPL